MNLSQTVDWIGKECEGYVINTHFSEENLAQIMPVIQKIKDRFGDSVFCMNPQNIHITLMDWVAPLVKYGGQDKHQIFRDLRPSYEKTLSDILSQYGPITLKFRYLEIHPTTVILKAKDNLAIQQIRDEFVARVGLPPETKKPPEIIHSSICRFVEPIDLDELKKLLKGTKIKFSQTVNEFYLKNTHREPQLDYEILKTFKLGDS